MICIVEIWEYCTQTKCDFFDVFLAMSEKDKTTRQRNKPGQTPATSKKTTTEATTAPIISSASSSASGTGTVVAMRLDGSILQPPADGDGNDGNENAGKGNAGKGNPRKGNAGKGNEGNQNDGNEENGNERNANEIDHGANVEQIHGELARPLSAEAKQFHSTQRSVHRLAEFVVKEEFQTLTYSAISLRYDRLTQLWNKGNDLFLQIISDLDDTPGLAESYQDGLNVMEEEYYEVAEALLNRMKDLEPNVGSVGRSVSEVDGNGTDMEQKIIKVQMPVQQHDMKNTWGYFDGDSMKWLGFRDRFLAAIHNNTDVSEAYKHSYLIESLKGEAAEALGQSHETKGSYSEAWNRLMELYNKPYKIARDYMRQFYSLPVLHTRATSTELQRMSNTTHETIRQLRALGLPVEEWDFVFVHNLHERLDNETAREWEKHRERDGMPTAKDILTFLDQEASASANDSNVRQPLRVTIDTGNRSRSNDRAASNSGTVSNMGTASNTGSASYTGTVPKKILCEACPQGSQQYHPLFYCPSFQSLNLNARKDFIGRRRICPNCFRKGHGTGSCNDPRRCTLPQCQGNPMHNSLICPFKQNKQLLTVQSAGQKKPNTD